MNYYLKVLQNYANFNGRARRKEYWMFFLFQIIFLWLAMFLDQKLGLTMENLPYGYIYMGYSLLTLVPGLAVAIRRMHDVGKSGWYILIPIYNLILACTEGQKGENEYGPDPKAGVAVA